MSWLSAGMLFESPAVCVADVRCHAPVSGCGETECGAVTEVLVPRRGAFKVHRQGQSVVADPNTVVVLRAGEPYRVSHPVEGGDVCTVLTFGPEVVEDALGTAARHGTLRPLTQLRARVLTTAVASRPADALEVEETAASVLGAVAVDLGLTGRAVGGVGRRRVEEVRGLLATRPATRWTLDGLARELSCSPFHLARQFRAVTGETVSRYLVRLRLGLALDRIADGEADLARLAAELGFAHHSHFSARFREVFGATPTSARTALTRRRVQELSTIVTAGHDGRP